jgi:hypothetical protein
VWRPENDPATVYQFGNKLWRNYILAIRPEDQLRRRGYGTAVKRPLIEEARKSGIIAITSLVAWNNTPTLELNKKLNASILRLPDDDEFALCIVPVLYVPRASR